jgi:hypothetical protein
MNTVADRPSSSELDQLSVLVAAEPLDRAALAAALRRIEHGLHEREEGLRRSGGLLDEADKAERMSLAREDDRLRDELAALIQNVQAVRDEATDGSDDTELRRRVGEVLAGLRGHRDAEAGLILESADTEVGSGD